MNTWVLAGLALLNVIQLALIVRLGGRVAGAERVNDRLSHFAEALTLLTDTTEAGLASVAGGLSAYGQKASSRAGTRATGRRIAKAVKNGQPVAAIAADEALSESEIRLHLELAEDRRTMEARRGTLRV